MDMTPHVVYASAKIAADSGKVCVQRGPVLCHGVKVNRFAVYGQQALFAPCRNADSDRRFLTPHVVYASAKIAADSGKVCVQRGALVYCAEEVDNGKGLPRLLQGTIDTDGYGMKFVD